MTLLSDIKFQQIQTNQIDVFYAKIYFHMQKFTGQTIMTRLTRDEIKS